MIRTPRSHCQGPKFNSWSETTVSVQPKKKKKFLERLSPPKVSKEQAMSDVPESGPSGDMGV